jgi:hypothetical protein
MTVEAKQRALDVVSRWRSTADEDNPAGPLFANGRYAEADIIVATWPPTGNCGTACSASRTRYCC